MPGRLGPRSLVILQSSSSSSSGVQLLWGISASFGIISFHLRTSKETTLYVIEGFKGIILSQNVSSDACSMSGFFFAGWPV